MKKLDFQQIAQDLLLGTDYSDDELAEVVGRLKAIWNARGQADRLAVANLMISQPSNIVQPIHYQIRELDE